MRARRLLLCLTLLSLMGWAGCGFSDPGDGTGTLLVTGALDATFDAQITELRFDVRQRGELVEDATITLHDADRQLSVVVPYDPGLGRYAMLWPGLHRRVRVQVAWGGEHLTAQVEAPARHTVAHPHAGAVLRLQDALDVRWATQDGIRADGVDVTVSHGLGPLTQHSLRHDSGQDHIAASALGAGALVLTITRKTELAPKGAAEGSLITCSYGVSTHLMRQ